jgi:hypothetical protein
MPTAPKPRPWKVAAASTTIAPSTKVASIGATITSTRENRIAWARPARCHVEHGGILEDGCSGQRAAQDRAERRAGEHQLDGESGAEQQLERDRGAQQLGEVAGDDRRLAQEP